MRLRSTAAALLTALALAVPAGTAAADEHDTDLGRLDYLIGGGNGGNERRSIRPAGLDTCYELNGTSNDKPATAVSNGTEGRAYLFPDRGCSGRPERILEPGDRVYDVHVRSVFFAPVDRHGHDDDGFGDGGFSGDGGDFASGEAAPQEAPPAEHEAGHEAGHEAAQEDRRAERSGTSDAVFAAIP
ncbi:hypothetical protein [Streptomyces sp. enrichment culture]|uniref:hypothetical protein n=1 Tax=Streptomyces sp. enrichment culture TaxID=1795815 RepID=UPI003F56E936